MISSIKSHKPEESYITNCNFFISNEVKEPIFSNHKQGGLIVKMDRLWVIDERYLSDELKGKILEAVKAHSQDSDEIDASLG